MSCILYYSNFCEHSKKLLQGLSKTRIIDDIHFICIDKRVNESGKMFIILENGSKIVMPENVTKVPALLLLKQNYKVLYGESIQQFLKPVQQTVVKQATFNNMEPMAFSLGEGMHGISSDNYSFLDMNSDELSAQGNGGLRQMHNYVNLGGSENQIYTPEDAENSIGKHEGLTIEQLQQQREQEFQQISSQQRKM